MNKRVIIIIVILISILVIVYLFLGSKMFSGPEEDMSQIINQGVLPSLGESTDPLKNKPDINPLDASNPFRSIKTNPFQ